MDQLLVEPGAEPAHETMLAERFPLITREDDQGVVHAALTLQGVEQLAEPAIDQGDRPGISTAQPEQLGFVEHVPHRAGGHVDQGTHLFQVELFFPLFLDEVPFLPSLELIGPRRRRTGRGRARGYPRGRAG